MKPSAPPWSKGTYVEPSFCTTMEQGKLRETFPLSSPAWSRGSYMKPSTPTSRSNKLHSGKCPKLYGDFQPWLLCIRSEPKVGGIRKVSGGAYDKVLTESGLALYYENISHPWMGLRHCKAQSECYRKPKHM